MDRRKAVPASAHDDRRDLGRPQRLAVWGGATGLMLLPVLATRVGADEVAWNPGAFMFLDILLVSVGAAYEFAARTRENRACRAAVGLALAAAFILVWMNLAVGIIGNEDNPAT